MKMTTLVKILKQFDFEANHFKDGGERLVCVQDFIVVGPISNASGLYPFNIFRIRKQTVWNSDP